MDDRRKRLLYRSTHRGMKEMDALLGGYAFEGIRHMSTTDLQAFEALMDESDNDLMNWIYEREMVPVDKESGVLRKIIEYKKSM